VDHYFRYDLAQADGRYPAADAIVHCAALSSPWASPRSYQANNVEATRNLVEHAKRNQTRFIFISSSSVYYTHGDQLNLTEEDPLPLHPINEYAATKRQAEELVRKAGIPHTILRPRAVFGPGDTVLFPRILRAAERGTLPRILRPDRQSPRADLIYIENLSHYVERAIALNATGTFNLTNNEPVDLYSFLDGLLDRLAIPKPRKTVNISTAIMFARAAELASQYLFNYREPPVTCFGVEVMAFSKTFDVSKMMEAFGPPPVSIESGVDRFLEWHRTQWKSH